jgi:hypothetical protein
MATPTYRYTANLADQPVDAAGRRWYVKEWHDAVARALDLRAELLAQALVRTGGLITDPTLDLSGSTATITGPVVGLTLDGLAPVVADQAGAGVALALATLGSGFADGTHSIVLRATATTEAEAFTTPEVVARDAQGNVIGQTTSETVTYSPRTALGVLVLIEGTTLADGDVLVATVVLTTGTWSALTAAGTPPILRAQDLNIRDVDTDTTVTVADAGGGIRATDDALVTLPSGVRSGVQAVIMNDTDDAAVVITAGGGATLVVKGGASSITPRGAITVVSLGGNAWRAYGDFIVPTGSGS